MGNADLHKRLERIEARLFEVAPMQPRQHYNIDQVAEMMSVSRDTVKRWLARQELRSFRHGSIVRIRRADLEKFQDKRTA